MSSLAAALPKPQQKPVAGSSKWDNDDDDDSRDRAALSKAVATQLAVRAAPPYGKRRGWIPRSTLDFGDGGAFPEIHTMQYPLDMGRKTGSAGRSAAGTLALQTDADGTLRYDMVLTHNARDGKIIHSQLKDLSAKDIADGEDESRAKPGPEELAKTTERTRMALEKMTESRIKANAPKGIVSSSSSAANAPQFIRYTPSTSSGTTAETRIIRMVEAPIDPMEPPKFKHKKVPRAPPSPPAPVLHSPPRKVSAEEQKNWVIPPCVSNWKNAKGYTIPLDKRLAADGRGIQDIQINDNFAKLGEALAIADRHAREEVRVRAEMQAKLAAKAKKEKEEKLRMLAQKAREERSGITSSAPVSAGGKPVVGEYQDSDASESEEDDEDEKKIREREEIRKERNRQRERELRMSHMGADTKAKVLGRLNSERDISEKIALGLTQPSASRESQFDQRLFNQSSGMSSGFGAEDSYNLYDKPLFTGSSANAIYRPKKAIDDHQEAVPGVRTDRIERIVEGGSMTRGPHKGFQGTEGGPGRGGRDGPVQFEREDEDVFGIDEFMSTAKRGRDE
ncbi:mRNA splicing protein [Entophlyctis luteolus]|nr:mRNA splicing protein [Entophlyctis luteolus]KAJ3393278.1 mRNA splicing protein [Entophlyctis sp. JEL0112]